MNPEKAEGLSPELQTALAPLLACIESVSEQICGGRFRVLGVILLSLFPTPMSVPEASPTPSTPLNMHNRLPPGGSLQTAESDAPPPAPGLPTHLRGAASDTALTSSGRERASNEVFQRFDASSTSPTVSHPVRTAIGVIRVLQGVFTQI
jgi:hypothetical protein